MSKERNLTALEMARLNRGVTLPNSAPVLSVVAGSGADLLYLGANGQKPETLLVLDLCNGSKGTLAERLTTDLTLLASKHAGSGKAIDVMVHAPLDENGLASSELEGVRSWNWRLDENAGNAAEIVDQVAVLAGLWKDHCQAIRVDHDLTHGPNLRQAII